MSHAGGMVHFEDGAIFHFEYNGTSDVCLPKLWETRDEMQEHWREDNYWKECSCDNLPKPVEIYTEYGSGLWWKGKACQTCRVIITCEPLGEDWYGGSPTWAQEKEE